MGRQRLRFIELIKSPVLEVLMTDSLFLLRVKRSAAKIVIIIIIIIIIIVNN